MTVLPRIPAMRRAGLHMGVLLLLLGMSSLAIARDVRMHGANSGGGECPEAAAAAAAPAKADTVSKPTSATTTPDKARASTSFRGSDDAGTRTPRWHRFLPGMFR
jgi:hypothetical protein